MLTVWGRQLFQCQKYLVLRRIKYRLQSKDVGGPFGGLDTPEYIKMNPNSTPTLQEDDFALWESNARFYVTLRKKFDHSHLLLAQDLQERAAADKWMDWRKHLFDHIKQMMKQNDSVSQKRIGDPEQAKIIYGNINRLLTIADNALANR